MFDPFSMFNGGMPNAEGMMMMEEVEEKERKQKLHNAVNFLYCHRYATVNDACRACGIKNPTDEEKKFIKSNAWWAT